MAQEKIKVSVIICVYTEDRWDDICAAIESCQNQTHPPTEIILSVDHNPKLLERIRKNLPDVIAVENKEMRGLSGARNSGILAAQEETIAFLDDDAMASSDWLERLTFCLKDPHVMGAGGVVEPIWEGGKPAWFPKEFNWVVGCSYLGLPDKTEAVRNLFGGCMCIRREVFDAVGWFRNGIGRDEKRPMGCEETELCIRANQRWPERFFIFEPKAWAYHRVPASRGKWKYFRARCFAEGLSKALVTRNVGVRDGLSAERSYTFHTLPKGVLRGIGAAFRGDPTGLLRAGAIIAGLLITTAGYGKGVLSRWLSRQAAPLVIEPGEMIEQSEA